MPLPMAATERKHEATPARDVAHVAGSPAEASAETELTAVCSLRPVPVLMRDASVAMSTGHTGAFQMLCTKHLTFSSSMWAKREVVITMWPS